MTTAHTPTPWAPGFTDDQTLYSGHRRVGTVACERPEWQANAAFIVRAVNAHDALVRALEELVGDYDDSGGIHPDECMSIIRAALRLARGDVS